MTSGNDAKLLIDGPAAKEAILRYIDHAKTSIRIRVYMWRNDRGGNEVLDALETKIARSPSIKIIIEKDTLGTKAYNFQRFITLGRIGGDIFSSERGEAFLRHTQVSFSPIGSSSLFFFKYLKENDHSKVYVFDEGTPECVAIIGGMNIADDYFDAQDREYPDRGGRHDYMVRISGKLTDPLISKKKKRRKWLLEKIRTGAEIIIDIKNRRVVRNQILKELLSAKRSIWIEHGYITDKLVISKLRKLAKRGIEIRIILPDRSDGAYHANMRSIYHLLKPSPVKHASSDIAVYVFRGKIHAKVMVIDAYTSIIGSANLTYGSFDLLRETNAIFREEDGITKQLMDQIESDLTHCTKVSLTTIPKHNIFLAWIQRLFI